jgi:tyrosine-protein phosphatase YwqE
MLSWLFGKSKTVESVNLSRIGIDIHSHLIPGIDDGVETVEESIEMILKMKSLGYSHIVTTPHIIWDCYKNTPQIIRDGLAVVQQACEAENIDIKLQAAAEYFIDEHFVEMLSTGQELLTLPGNRLLVELPYSTPLMNTSETLFDIIEKGYQPVLAHPERYVYFHSEPNIFSKLVAQGCELQVNILSLGGYYGPNVGKMATWLLENNLVTFLGTDAHKMAHLNMILKSNKNGWLARYPFQNEILIEKQ